MMVVCIVLVSMRARLEPQELPTHRTSAFLSVPMRRGPCDHGNGLPLVRLLKLSYNVFCSGVARSISDLSKGSAPSDVLPVVMSALPMVSNAIWAHQPLPSRSPAAP